MTASEGQRGARTSYSSPGPGGLWVTTDTRTQPALRWVPGPRSIGEVWELPQGHQPVSMPWGTGPSDPKPEPRFPQRWVQLKQRSEVTGPRGHSFPGEHRKWGSGVLPWGGVKG